MDRIAIITVTYSPGEHLWNFVQSIPAATHSSAYLMMVDNGSTDGVPQAVEHAAATGELEIPVQLRHSGGNIGYGAGMNAGVRMLHHAREEGSINQEFFLISNPDVVLSPGSIDQMLRVAQENPRAGAIGPLIVNTDGSVYPSAREIPTLGKGIGHALLGSVWPGNPWTQSYKNAQAMDKQRDAGWLSGSCLLLRWDAFDAVGGFDERYFMYMEDVDLGDRLARAGWRNIFTPQARISHAQGHAASKHPERTLTAHHESAYRFQADRLTGWRNAPVRAVLWLGLKVRRRVAVLLALRAARRAQRAV